MKFTVTPLLDGKGATKFTLEKEALKPRVFADLMDARKALLFQSSEEPLSAEDFGKFVVNLDLEYYPYIGGAAPRSIIPVSAGKDIIFTANERQVVSS